VAQGSLRSLLPPMVVPPRPSSIVWCCLALPGVAWVKRGVQES
jgi:hypothetical protein